MTLLSTALLCVGGQNKSKQRQCNGICGNNRRFTKGNTGGPGNPYARRVAALKQAMLEASSADDLQDIVRGLVDRAKQGEKDSICILFDRLFGKPTATQDSDRIELEELTLARLVRMATPTKTQVLLQEMDL